MTESLTEPIDRASVLAELELVLAHPVFKRAERSSALLRFLVVQTLDGHADRLKEYTLGSEALGRGESFDPRIDPVVRAEASRLRGRLEQYYESAGPADALPTFSGCVEAGTKRTPSSSSCSAASITGSRWPRCGGSKLPP